MKQINAQNAVPRYTTINYRSEKERAFKSQLLSSLVFIHTIMWSVENRISKSQQPSIWIMAGRHL